MRSLLSLVYLIPRFHSSEREPIRIVIDGANHAKAPFFSYLDLPSAQSPKTRSVNPKPQLLTLALLEVD